MCISHNHAIILSPHTGVVTAQLKRALTVVSNSEPEPKRKRNKIKPKEVCGSCKKIVQKLQSQMIQCDLCDQWYHYECVGTTADEAAKIDFACPGSCT